MKILIADDHTLFRDTLSQYIQRAQPNYNLRMVSNLNEVVSILNHKEFSPDLCILDFRMPGMKGHESFQNLILSYPGQPFAVMSGNAEIKDIEKIIDTGVLGFLPKTLSGRVLLKAIDGMLKGQKYVPYEDGDGRGLMPCYASDGETASRKIHLTPREKDVLKLLCEGRSNKEIAELLKLKIVTVKLHIRGIFRKLNCDNRTRAALKAKEWRLLH